MRYTLAVLMILAGLTVYAEDEHKGEPAQQENFFKRAGKQIGHDAQGAATQAGHAFKDAGTQIGHGTVKAVKDLGHAMKASSAKTKEAVKQTLK